MFHIFFSVSAVALGGGLAMLPVLNDEFVEKRKWLTPEAMVDTVAVMQSSPGIIGTNMAVLIGYRTAGIAGAFVSAAGVFLPPFFAILIVAALTHSMKYEGVTGQIFRGVRAGVCALIMVSVIQLWSRMKRGKLEIALALVGFVTMVFFDWNAILLVILAGAAGIAFRLKQCRRELEKK